MNWLKDADICFKEKKRCFTKKQITKAMAYYSHKRDYSIHSYKCNFCGDYHLTKRTPKKKKD